VSALINFLQEKNALFYVGALRVFGNVTQMFKQALTAPCSQELLAGPCPEPNESSSHTHSFLCLKIQY